MDTTITKTTHNRSKEASKVNLGIISAGRSRAAKGRELLCFAKMHPNAQKNQTR